MKKSQYAVFSENDPIAQGNLYVFPDNSLFLRFDKNTNKASILQNTYNKKLMLYGVYIGQSVKKMKKAMKSKKWKLKDTAKYDTRTIFTYKKGKKEMKIWTENKKTTGYQWIRQSAV